MENLSSKKLFYLRKTKLLFSKFLTDKKSNKPFLHALQLILEEAEFVYSILYCV